MDRRTFVGVFAGGVVIARSAFAQPAPRVYRIGYLAGTAAQDPMLGRTFNEELRDAGYVEGRNVVFERRFAEGQLGRLPELAVELVRARVDVIVALTNPGIAAAKRATSTIPIVMLSVSDPVGAGFVASLARPGGNITGVTTDAGPEILAKNLGLLKEVVPKLARVGVLRQAATANSFEEIELAARKLNVALVVTDFRGADNVERAFATMASKRAGGFIIMGGALAYLRRQQIVDLAIKYRLPGIHLLKEYAQAGLLMTNGPSLIDINRRAAQYVAKILGGANPANLPVEQPTKLELVINLKTAKALGLTIPQAVLLRADDVIQ